MAGAGVTPDNATELVQSTGVTWLHGSARCKIEEVADGNRKQQQANSEEVALVSRVDDRDRQPHQMQRRILEAEFGRIDKMTSAMLVRSIICNANSEWK